MDNLDQSVSRLCNRLMGAEQQSLDTLTYTVDEMEYLAQQNPARDDIKACIEEIKSKIKADEAEHWVIANRWSEHFDGITEDDEGKKEDNDTDPESDEAGEEEE